MRKKILLKTRFFAVIERKIADFGRIFFHGAKILFIGKNGKWQYEEYECKVAADLADDYIDG